MGTALIEIWKPIPGYESSYEVSNLGNVRSKDRVIYQKDSHGGMMYKRYRGKPVAQTDNGQGYKIVSLGNFGRKNHYVHRLVAEMFVDNPNGFTVVNHLDYNTNNNRADNLEWTTIAGNVRHSINRMRHPRTKCRKTMTGEKYITIRKGKYRFSISHGGISFDRAFDTLEEAISKRNEVIENAKYYAI